jgi:hypothetical protein
MAGGGRGGGGRRGGTVDERVSVDERGAGRRRAALVALDGGVATWMGGMRGRGSV